MYYAEFGQALAGFDVCLLLPISSGLADETYGQQASITILREAAARHGTSRVVTCRGYDDAASALASMMRAGDVVVSLGTGSPYLVLDRLAASAGRAAS